MALRVLRKISQAALSELHDPSGENHLEAKTDRPIPQDWLYLDKKARYFRKGYIDNDLPRAGAVTDTIMENTEGFALWDDEQGMIREGIATVAEAEKIRASAKISVNVDFDIPEEAPEAASDE